MTKEAPRAVKGALPIPPFEMRQLVGPTDESAFENPDGKPIFGLPESQFESVLDFGCGCGRLARQMIHYWLRVFSGVRIRPKAAEMWGSSAGWRPPAMRWGKINYSTARGSISFNIHDGGLLSYIPIRN